MDPRGEEVSLKLHIGDYYDFRDPASSVAFTQEMIADPIGNETIAKDDPRAERKKPLPKVMLFSRHAVHITLTAFRSSGLSVCLRCRSFGLPKHGDQVALLVPWHQSSIQSRR